MSELIQGVVYNSLNVASKMTRQVFDHLLACAQKSAKKHILYLVLISQVHSSISLNPDLKWTKL